jgi:hypothetical protein
VRWGILSQKKKKKKIVGPSHFLKPPHLQNVPQNGTHLLLEEVPLLARLLIRVYTQHDETSTRLSQQNFIQANNSLVVCLTRAGHLLVHQALATLFLRNFVIHVKCLIEGQKANNLEALSHRVFDAAG